MALAAPKYLEMADQGDTVPASELFGALEAVAQLRGDMSRLMAGWDLILTPTAAAQPWPAGQPFPQEIDGKPVGPRGHAIYTGWVNATGHPAIALPAAPDAEGLPVGYQLIGDLGAEPLLLDLAETAAAARTWQWPQL